VESAVVLEKLPVPLLVQLPPVAPPLGVAVTDSVDPAQIESVVWLSVTPAGVLTVKVAADELTDVPQASVTTQRY
jgi:hypothetical protein